MAEDQIKLELLLQRTFDGDRFAYFEVLKRLRRVLRLYVRQQLLRVGRSDAETEDIVQEALIAIHNKWHSYDRSMPVTAWAYAIARFKLIDFLRSTNNSARHLPLHEIEDRAGADAHGIEGAITIRNLVASLPLNLRRSVELVKFKGLSIKEAATVTGLSEAAVKVNIHRALKRLSHRLWKDA